MSTLAILTYHPIHIVETSYSGSDLVALERDLATIEASGVPIRSLAQSITPASSPDLLIDGDPAVAITFDDGSVFDFLDHDHPTCGPQRSAASIMAASALTSKSLAGARPLATTFVIASPDAREELDRRDFLGGGYWADHWWAKAAESGILAIESHSWDHNHPSIARSAQRDNIRGTFNNIETFEEAEAEIAQSVDYIARRSGARPRFFAYPWGEASKYLLEEYFPRRGPALGLQAALSCGKTHSGYVTNDSNRWLIPRFVCGYDWTSTAELEALLERLKEGGH